MIPPPFPKDSIFKTTVKYLYVADVTAMVAAGSGAGAEQLGQVGQVGHCGLFCVKRELRTVPKSLSFLLLPNSFI